MSAQHFETLRSHAGQEINSTTKSRAVPIYQITSYGFDNLEHAANLFGLRLFENIYTRIVNPTTDLIEKHIATLEGGMAALATGSVQAAQFLALNNIMQTGNNFITSSYTSAPTTSLKYLLNTCALKPALQMATMYETLQKCNERKN